MDRLAGEDQSPLKIKERKPTSQIDVIQLRNEIPNLPADFLSQAYNGGKPNISEGSHKNNQLFREEFNRANTVLFVLGGYGLGDAVQTLRFPSLVAKKTDKKILAQIPQALMDIPGGATYIPKVNRELLTDPNVFIIYLNTESPLTLTDNTAQWSLVDPTETVTLLKQKENSHQLSSYAPSAFGHYRDFLRRNGYDQLAEDGNISDIVFATQLRQLGLPLTSEEIRNHTAITVAPEAIKVTQDIDVLYAPDAKEFLAHDEKRSQKSLGLYPNRFLLEKIAQRFPQLHLGILIGSVHPEFCQKIADLAQDVGLTTTIIRGKRLNDFFVPTMARSKMFLGNDTGTTHLAEDVSEALRQKGKKVGVMEIFHSGFVDETQYGIRPPGKIIRIAPQGLLRTSDYLSAFPNDDLAFFTEIVLEEIQSL